jgi:hypothetical protein
MEELNRTHQARKRVRERPGGVGRRETADGELLQEFGGGVYAIRSKKEKEKRFGIFASLTRSNARLTVTKAQLIRRTSSSSGVLGLRRPRLKLVVVGAWNGGGGDVATCFYSSKVALRMDRGGLGAGFDLVELGGGRKAPTSIFGRCWR